MIHVQGKLPRSLAVACSGGPDSMAVAHFLAQKHQVFLVFYHHGTEASDHGYEKVMKLADSLQLPVIRAGFFDVPKDQVWVPEGRSKEDWWRECRYTTFHSIQQTVVTAHHLDDCVETWIWSACHGDPKIIPYQNKNVIRPFRKTERIEFEHYVDRHQLDVSHDPSNDDTRYVRNHIRHVVIPTLHPVNPGLKKVIRKKVEQDV